MLKLLCNKQNTSPDRFVSVCNFCIIAVYLYVYFFQLVCEYLDSKDVYVISPTQSWHIPGKERMNEYKNPEQTSGWHAYKSQVRDSFWKDFIFGFDMTDFSKPELWGKDTHLAFGRLLLETTQTRIN